MQGLGEVEVAAVQGPARVMQSPEVAGAQGLVET